MPSPSQTIPLSKECSLTCPAEWIINKPVLERLKKAIIDLEKHQKKIKDSQAGPCVEYDKQVHDFMHPLIKDGRIDRGANLKVKDLRAWVPQLFMMLFNIRHDDNQRKVKNMWTTAPKDWPPDVPFRDPNNNSGGAKPNKEQLEKMFHHLAERYIKKKYAANRYPIQESKNEDDEDNLDGDEEGAEESKEEEHESDIYWKQQQAMDETKPMDEKTSQLAEDLNRLDVSCPEKYGMMPGPETPLPTYVPSVTQADDSGSHLYDMDRHNIVSAPSPSAYGETEQSSLPASSYPTIQYPLPYPALPSGMSSMMTMNAFSGVICQTNTYMPVMTQVVPFNVEIPLQPVQSGAMQPLTLTTVQYSQQETPKQESVIPAVESMPQQSISDRQVQLSEEEYPLPPLPKQEILSPLPFGQSGPWDPHTTDTQGPENSMDAFQQGSDIKKISKIPPLLPSLTTQHVEGMEEEGAEVGKNDEQVPDVAAHLEVNTHTHNEVPPNPREDVAAYEDIEEQQEEMMETSEVVDVPFPLKDTHEKVISSKSLQPEIVLPLPSEEAIPVKLLEQNSGFNGIPATVSDFEPKRKNPPGKKQRPLCHPKKRRINLPSH